MEALDKCSRSSPATTGDTVITRAEHQLGDNEEVGASRAQDLDTPSLSDQPRAQETEDTEAGILATHGVSTHSELFHLSSLLYID